MFLIVFFSINERLDYTCDDLFIYRKGSRAIQSHARLKAGKIWTQRSAHRESWNSPATTASKRNKVTMKTLSSLLFTSPLAPITI